MPDGYASAEDRAAAINAVLTGTYVACPCVHLSCLCQLHPPPHPHHHSQQCLTTGSAAATGRCSHVSATLSTDGIGTAPRRAAPPRTRQTSAHQWIFRRFLPVRATNNADLRSRAPRPIESAPSLPVAWRDNRTRKPLSFSFSLFLFLCIHSDRQKKRLLSQSDSLGSRGRPWPWEKKSVVNTLFLFEFANRGQRAMARPFFLSSLWCLFVFFPLSANFVAVEPTFSRASARGRERRARRRRVRRAEQPCHPTRCRRR